MNSWKVITPPKVLPVTPQQCATNASIDDLTTWMDWLSDAIAAATEYAEGEAQLSFITRTISAVFFPERDDVIPEAYPLPYASTVTLFRPPVQSVISANDRYGSPIWWEPREVGNLYQIQFKSSVVTPLTVVYTAGLGDTPNSIPADIRRAIIAHVGHMFRFREADRDSEPVGLKNIYARYRANPQIA